MLTGATAFCPDPWLSPPHPAAVSGALSRTPRPWMGKFLAWHHQTRFPNPSGPQPAATFLGGVDPDSSIACPRPVVHGPGLTETVQGRCCLASDRQRARIPNHITFQLGLLFSPLCNAILRHQAPCVGLSAPFIMYSVLERDPFRRLSPGIILGFDRSVWGQTGALTS